MVNNSIDSFTRWDEIVDYESDQHSVVLTNAKGEKVAEYGYGGFTKADFDYFKEKGIKHENI